MRWLLLIYVALALCLCPSSVSSAMEVPFSSPHEWLRWQERERLEEGQRVMMAVPYFNLSDETGSRLLLMNRFSDVLEFTVTVANEQGREILLAVIDLQPRETTELDLRQAFELVGESLAEGSLSVSYFGDSAMAQGWLLQDSPKGSFAMPLSTVSHARTLVTFWTRQKQAETQVVVAAFNPHDHPVPVRLLPERKQDRSSLLMAPARASLIIPVAEKADETQGSLWIQQPTNDGLIIRTYLMSPELLQPLPIGSVAAVREAHDYLSLHELDGEELGQAQLTVYDARKEGEAQEVNLSLLDFDSGKEIQRSTVVSKPSNLQVLSLEEIFATSSQDVVSYRLKIGSTLGGVMPSLTTTNPSGVSTVLELVKAQEAHATGTYPIPDMSRHEAWITLVNVSPQPTEVAGQVTWQDGAYALGPFHVPGHGARKINFRQVADLAEPDLLGRILPKELEAGFFQWSVRKGSRQLIARLEQRREGEAQSVGFNCTNCCPEMPTGDLLPASVAFDVGQTPSFETIEYVSTCNGTMGPFGVIPDSLSYSAPLSWDGSRISTTDYTNQTASFSARREGIRLDCRTITVDIFDSGDVTVDKCQKQHNPDHDPTKGCFQQSSGCSSCFDCCEAQKDVALCRCAKIGSPPSCRDLVVPSCQKCKERCVGQFLDGCSGTTACTL